MPVVIQDFEAVQDDGHGSGDAGRARPQPGPVADAALDRMLAVRRGRLARLWAN